MGILTKLAQFTALSTGAGLSTFFIVTRKNTFVPMDPATLPLFQSAQAVKFNPNNNPTFHDDCMRRVPLSQIKPELLEKEGALVTAFCQGVWSGPGYTLQRKYLQRTHYNALTSSQLWSPRELQASSYPIGTQVTDHFEVVERTPSSVVFRCGDSPRIRDVRPSEGLFEMAVDVKLEEDVAEFHLRSVFWQGQGKVESGKPPMGGYVVWLHQQYDKLWMESALRNVKK